MSGRILVDFHGYAKHHQGLQRLEKTTGNQALETQGPEDTSTKTTETYRKRLNAKEQAANKEKMLARAEDLMFVSPMLLGFALKDKLWRKTSHLRANTNWMTEVIAGLGVRAVPIKSTMASVPQFVHHVRC